jgi:UDP-2,3-diacylglucosamine pyrophosphatase LpxH
MLLLVLSDFHLGRGKFLEDGQVNILEDFDEDEKFAEFLDHYSTGTYYFSDVKIILNGDIFNLIQMDVDGKFTHLLTEDHICTMVDQIIEGHPLFFQSLRKFLSRPNKSLTYVIGNHDLGMVFEKAQDLFRKAVSDEKVAFTHQYSEYGVLVEHGHRFEPINTVPRSKLFIKGPDEKPILNLPWASLFCIYMLTKLKEIRPYIDKVRPLSLYVKWTIFHDFRFFIYLCWAVFGYILRTQFPPYGRYNKNFYMSPKQLIQISIHPKYETNAKRVLATRPDVKVVVMGHTHITEWRRFKDGRLYFNTGTWNHVPSVDQAMHKTISHLTYVCIEVNEKQEKIQNAFLNVWQGKWRPYREEVTTGFDYKKA